MLGSPLNKNAPLKRSLSLPLITFYGLGSILGAGIYVLIGEVVARAGYHAPTAFLVASVLAAFSAFSYAELSARFPLSAGEAVYLQRAFGRRWFSMLFGLMIVMIGVVSGATLVNGFVGYLQVFIAMPAWLIITLLVLVLGGVAAWGITQSAIIAALATLIELGGLLIILWVSRHMLGDLPSFLPQMVPTFEPGVWLGIAGAAFIAFYAYIGFEDMVNVAEEVKRPTRNLPLAIFLAFGIATLLYLAVSIVALLVVPPAELGGSGAPLALVYEQATGSKPIFISLISLAAVVNGALIQFILASRVLYGMASQGWLPSLFGKVHPATQTPLFSTLLITLVVLLLALWLTLVTLAKVTSLITLLVFSMVNLSLWVVKRRDPRPLGITVFPAWLPMLGFITSFTFACLQIVQGF
jgi:APA family basic amino acid/polyamine antiporter